MIVNGFLINLGTSTAGLPEPVGEILKVHSLKIKTADL
jgi:hypothetical protein